MGSKWTATLKQRRPDRSRAFRRSWLTLPRNAARHDATPQQVALAFLLRHPQVFVIPKAGRVEHVEQNAAAARLELGEADVAAIESAFPVGPRRHGVAML